MMQAPEWVPVILTMLCANEIYDNQPTLGHDHKFKTCTMHHWPTLNEMSSHEHVNISMLLV